MSVVEVFETSFFENDFVFRRPLKVGESREIAWREDGVNTQVQILEVTGPDSVRLQWMRVDDFQMTKTPIGFSEKLTKQTISKEVLGHPLGFFGFDVAIVWEPSGGSSAKNR